MHSQSIKSKYPHRGSFQPRLALGKDEIKTRLKTPILAIPPPPSLSSPLLQGRSFYLALKRRPLIKGAKSLAHFRDKRAYLKERYGIHCVRVRLIYFETLRIYNDSSEKKVSRFLTRKMKFLQRALHYVKYYLYLR